MSGSVYTLTDEDRTWLQSLNAELWAKEHLETPEIKHRIEIKARRPLTPAELERVEAIILGHSLMTDMFCIGMFGGYGMDVYEHEPAPDMGPIHLLRLVEGNMPDPTPEQLAENPGKYSRPGGGVGRDDAWECFSKHTHSERNVGWLKSYKRRPPEVRSRYDY